MGTGKTGIGKLSRGVPFVAAFVVTVLWSSSYVPIKLGLADIHIPPLYFATVRYALAFSILLAFDVATASKRAWKVGTRRQAALLVVAGIGGYTVAQGLQFLGLFYLTAVATSFLLNFNPFFVLVLSVGLLGEGTSSAQMGGLGLALVGAWLFFSQQGAVGGQPLGVLVVIVSGLGWACYVVVARLLQRTGSMSALRFTTITMGIGVVGMIFLTALSGEYAPLSLNGVLIIVWLATANTALAFFLWNWTLRVVPAYELTVLQDLMLVEIAIFAFLFLQETITPLMVGGMALVLLGVLVVQMKAWRGEPPLRGAP